MKRQIIDNTKRGCIIETKAFKFCENFKLSRAEIYTIHIFIFISESRTFSFEKSLLSKVACYTGHVYSRCPLDFKGDKPVFSVWYCQFDVSPVNYSDSDSVCYVYVHIEVFVFTFYESLQQQQHIIIIIIIVIIIIIIIIIIIMIIIIINTDISQ